MIRMVLVLTGVLLTVAVFPAALLAEKGETVQQKDPLKLAAEVVAAVGGKERLLALKDVQFTYLWRDVLNQRQDVSLERYIFHPPSSWGHYPHHEKVYPGEPTKSVIQARTLSKSWMLLDGKPVEGERWRRNAMRQRQLNFHWFTMMFRLADSDLQHTYKGTRSVDGIQYDLLEVRQKGRRDDAIPDAYLLYVNPETKLVDRFLFSGQTRDTLKPGTWMTEVRYEEKDGVKLPAYRKVFSADWDGTASKADWHEAIILGVTFNNGFPPSLFAGPEQDGTS